ncbi:LytR/AlgR family response regulator transcription factor [Maribacter thermophilus]|uniref:LytR/AlgR family response regulator transcription factor n=1 Tax=Maribacter thermophilus TaxID=1197874 RepID=UPI000640EE66|nr:LytTR family DNA-binding domain-containing protein [Maribacter thermophilus]
MEYSYTIIDPDAVSNLQLSTFLAEYGDFNCSGISETPDDGLNLILKFSPDIVFVNLDHDAQLIFQKIIELHQYITELPLIIGISKTKNHAYDAIKNGFFDYWLQPFNEFDVRKSILKLKRKVPKEKEPQTICLKSYNDFHYLNTEDILYLQADNNTTEFFMKDGSVANAYKTLKTFEKQLPKNFVRIHQSYIVNTDYVSRINFGKSICSLKKVDKKLPFSKSYKEKVNQLKQTLSKNSISSLN